MEERDLKHAVKRMNLLFLMAAKLGGDFQKQSLVKTALDLDEARLRELAEADYQRLDAVSEVALPVFRLRPEDLRRVLQLPHDRLEKAVDVLSAELVAEQ